MLTVIMMILTASSASDGTEKTPFTTSDVNKIRIYLLESLHWVLKSNKIFPEELREYFGKYGEIESINVKTDSMTGRSRGFAFIVFQDAASIDRVSAAGEHTINGKKVDPKKAKARHGKIFVGGISPELSDDDINEYFGQYGTVSNHLCW